MNKEITEKKFSLNDNHESNLIGHNIIFIIQGIYAADKKNTAELKDNNTAKYQGTISGDRSGKAKIRIYGKLFDNHRGQWHCIRHLHRILNDRHYNRNREL